MILVVADTSPLNYLLLIGCIDVLPRLFDRVAIPPAVHRELQHPDTPETVRRWAASPPQWIEIHAPGSVLQQARLQAGEAEAIALARELHADAILLDEREGRAAALEQGLKVTGTIGVLEEAAARGLLDLPSALARLQQTSFKVHPSLIQAALKRWTNRQ